MDAATLADMYAGLTGMVPLEVTPIAGAGSNRRYFRLAGESVLIGAEGTDRRENEAFVYLARHFRNAGLPVPEVVAVSDDGMAYLQEDLGDTSLFDLIRGGITDEVRQLLSVTIRLLPEIQFRGNEGLDYARCYPQAEFDSRTVMWDLNYFKYCFLKGSGVEFDEAALEDDFRRMAEDLCGDNCGFMYRDFQSRNVMIKDGKPWLIDFQGGRRGPYLYDVASFLWQARAGFSDELRQELVEEYVDAASDYIAIDRSTFQDRLRLFVLFRTMQVLGAYGFRGYFERKRHFIDSIPPAIDNLRGLLAEPLADYPALDKVLRRLVDMPRFASHEYRGLTVRVTSFSYKKGIPEDPSGNGGGYVFDCRAIHNPGRYDRYKQLTGLDRPVKEFLEDDGEIKVFLDHCRALTDASVERYIKRGFTDLAVSFGCTGGQHRSVYSAQYMAEHISEIYGVRVILEHRERGLKSIFEPR